MRKKQVYFAILMFVLFRR